MAKKLTEEQVQTIYTMVDNGYSYEEIAKEVGCHIATVWSRMKKRRMPNAPEEFTKAEPAEQKTVTWLDAFQPLYQRERELLKQRDEINQELRNIKATLKNAIDMIERGEQI